MNNLTEFQQRAAAMALVKMLKGKHFSICDLDKLADLLGRKAACAGPDYKALHNLHCVDYGDMEPELTQQVREKCVEILGLSPVITDAEFREARQEPMHKPAKRLRLAFWKDA